MLSVRQLMVLVFLFFASSAHSNWREPIYQSALAKYSAHQECITKASQLSGIPEMLLMSVIWQEYGTVGEANKNKPNVFGETNDYGIMQINDVRLLKHKQHIPTIKNNGCANIHLGSRMLSKEIARAGDFWTGVGNYHYRSGGKYRINHVNYIKNVHAKWLALYQIHLKSKK